MPLVGKVVDLLKDLGERRPAVAWGASVDGAARWEVDDVEDAEEGDVVVEEVKRVGGD